MKTIHTVLSVIAIGVAGSAFAGGGPYPVDEPPAEGPGKSRAEVIAEFKEAQRLGLVSTHEAGMSESTPQQEALIAAAGRRAAEEERYASTPTPSETAEAKPAPQTSAAGYYTPGRRLMRL
jgi:hypothetical protein